MRERMCNLAMPSFARRRPNLERTGRTTSPAVHGGIALTRLLRRKPRPRVSPAGVKVTDRRTRSPWPRHILCKGLHCLLAWMAIRADIFRVL